MSKIFFRNSNNCFCCKLEEFLANWASMSRVWHKTFAQFKYIRV